MDRECTLTLSTPSAHATLDSIELTVSASFVAPISEQAVTEDVPCVDLAEFIRQLDGPVALLKLDIEGAEVPVLNRLLDTGLIDQVKMAVVETHERLSPELATTTAALRKRIEKADLGGKIRLDWI